MVAKSVTNHCNPLVDSCYSGRNSFGTWNPESLRGCWPLSLFQRFIRVIGLPEIKQQPSMVICK